MHILLHRIAKPWARRAQLRMDYLPPDELAELQWRKLRRLLRVAYDRTPFYRRRFEEIGATPDDMRTPDDFAKIPPLTRDDIVNHVGEMLACPPAALHRGTSGGSTGHPLIYYYDHDYKYYYQALRHRLHSWVGAAGLRPALMLWGMSIDPNVPGTIRPWHRLVRQSFRYRLTVLSEGELAALVRDYPRIRPAMVFGYASILLSLARYVRGNGLSLEPPPRLVLSTAETLYPEHRAAIEDSFHAPVYNIYGSSENPYLAGECPARQGLHVVGDHIYLEVQAGGRPAAPGEPGHLLVTDLDNLAMPFIRYRNEDIGTWSAAKTCSCGRSLPMLARIHGRETDFLFDREGAAYPGADLIQALHPVAAGGRVRQFQFVQSEKGRLQVLAVPGRARDSAVEADLCRALAAVFRGGMEIGLVWVEVIPREPSGKTRFIRSTIPYGVV